MFRILVVEDDRNTLRLMDEVLKREGYTVLQAEDGFGALDVMDKEYVDLIILDVMLPGIDGFQFTQQLRDCGIDIPILMVTAKQLPEDKRKGFLAGTDDYMVKPVDEEEMLLRIKALLRRSQIIHERKLKVGGVTLDYDTLTVSKDKTVKVLAPKEFYLLFKLLSYPGKIFTRLQLMDEIWGMESETTDTTVNVHINRLRKQFKDWPEFKIVTVRGIGYKAEVKRDKTKI